MLNVHLYALHSHAEKDVLPQPLMKLKLAHNERILVVSLQQISKWCSTLQSTTRISLHLIFIYAPSHYTASWSQIINKDI